MTENGYQPIGDATLLPSADITVCARAGDSLVEVTALAPDLFRVGLFPAGRPADYSSAAVIDAGRPEIEVRREQDRSTVRVHTAECVCEVSLSPLRVRFLDASGAPFLEDDPDLGMGVVPRPAPNPWDAGFSPRLYKRHRQGERYLGCGERTGGLDKTDSVQVFWNADMPINQAPAQSNLYASYPIVLSLLAGQVRGLFVDNPGRLEFDLAHSDGDRARVAADTGSLIYYVFAGPTFERVLERYTELTGRTPLPPMWALGFHQSRWGYRSADEIRALAATFRERDIPCDAIHLDIDYMDGYRVFTWDPERFPDPTSLVSDLSRQGFHTITIVDPGVKVDEGYRIYREGRDRDLYCRTLDGAEYHNVVWPGLCAFPDFSNPATREWWAGNHAALLDAGVAGIWCDMDEPSTFIPHLSTFPPNVIQPGADRPRRHEEIHNLYGLQMAQSAWEGLSRLRPDRRPVVISRAGYPGLQRYALQWTGDNSSLWEHLQLALPQLQTLGISGMAWVGVDMGGFFGDSTGELVERWTEFGIFQPFCRNHNSAPRAQEPWQFGPEWEAHIRAMLRLRMRLLPYLYSAFEQCSRTGAPVMRPLVFAEPDDAETYDRGDQFLVGNDLLVAPITQPGTFYRYVYLPAGDWFHWWTGERASGPAHVLAHAPYGRPPVYVRANAAVPLWPAMNYVGERPADPLTLRVHPADGERAIELYEDAGDGHVSTESDFLRTRISCSRSGSTVRLRADTIAGSYAPERRIVRLELVGPTSARSARANSRPIEWTIDGNALVIELTGPLAGAEITLDLD